MRKVLTLGAALMLIGSMNIAVAQERLQQSSGGSAMGVGTGVGDVSGSANRVQTFDRSAFLDRLSLPETIYGRVLAIDFPAGKMLLETGGSSHDEGRAGTGAMSSLTVYFDERTNLDQFRALNNGDDIALQVVEATSPNQPYGTGHKIVREVYLLRGNEKLAGFGGLGQRRILDRAGYRDSQYHYDRWSGGIGVAWQNYWDCGYHCRRIYRYSSLLELRASARVGV